MLHVFICEDDELQREKLVGVIKNYLYMQDYDCRFEFDTGDPQELLTYVSQMQEEATGLYFLDVNLNTEMNGISLGAEIRNVDPTAKIVFVTTHAELAYLTFLYKVEAMDYIPKDNQGQLQKKVTDCIDVAVKRHLNVKNDSDFLMIKNGDIHTRVAIADVQFIESSATPHRLLAHLDNHQIEFYGKIKDVPNWHPYLYRCHQSYVVNLQNIKEVDPKSRVVTTKDGEVCYASIRYLKGLLNRLNEGNS